MWQGSFGMALAVGPCGAAVRLEQMSSHHATCGTTMTEALGPTLRHMIPKPCSPAWHCDCENRDNMHASVQEMWVGLGGICLWGFCPDAKRGCAKQKTNLILLPQTRIQTQYHAKAKLWWPSVSLHTSTAAVHDEDKYRKLFLHVQTCVLCDAFGIRLTAKEMHLWSDC